MNVEKIITHDGVSYYYEVATASQKIKVTIEKIMNPLKHKFAFNPNTISKNLKEEIIEAIANYEEGSGETLSD